MEQMIDLKKYVPVYNKEVWITTPYGIRRAVYNRGTVGFMYLDCTHPAQQGFIHECMVLSWIYVNQEDRDNIIDLMTINHYERAKEGQKILSSIKVSFWQKLKDKFKAEK